MRQFKFFVAEATMPHNAKSIASAFEKVLKPFEKKDAHPYEIVKAANKLSKKYSFTASFKLSPELDAGDTSIIGFYDMETDRENEAGEFAVGSGDPPIEIVFVFSPKEKKISFKKDDIKFLAAAIAETLVHELIHMSQARAREWKETNTKKDYYRTVKMVHLGSYLGHDDEIEAHAFNIAGSLLDKFGTKRQAVDFLKRPKMGVVQDHHFDMYLNTFGLGHEVMKRLYKKVITYMDQRTSGK